MSLFCDFVFFSIYLCIFHCILPVPTPQYTIILLLLPNVMLRCCFYTCSEHLTSRYVKKPLGLSCLLDFRYFSTHFWHFSVYSSCFFPDVHCFTNTTCLYVSHWTLNHTWIAYNYVIFCMSSHYHSHLRLYYPTWLRFWSSGSLVESTWCDYVMVEADSCLKLLPTSILYIYKVFQCIEMLSMGIQYEPFTVIPTHIGSDLEALGHLWSQNDVIMSWLSLTAT